MAHRSQCSSAGDNPLDPNYLPPHYREEYRLAIDALIEADLEGYYGFLREADVVDFLSQTEIEYIKCTVQGPNQSVQPDRRYMVGDGDGSSDTYWPIQSDLDAPGLDLGWPPQHRFVGPTEITTLVNPPDPETQSIKEHVRKMIKDAQQVVAVVMDMFTDVDIFADILNAAMRNVAIYVLLDELNAHHFIAMANNCRVNLEEIKFLRVRTVSGSTYFCHTGKSFKGQMMNRFMLVDCRFVLSGNYSFMWSFEKINRCLAHVFAGELVTTFDEEFRILYAQSEPLVTENPMAYVEDYGNLPGRHNIENPHIFQRQYAPIEDIRTEWPGHSFDDHMNVRPKRLPFRRDESIHSSTDEHLSLPMHATQQFAGEHSYMDQRRLMKGPNKKEMGVFKMHGYTGIPIYPQINPLNRGEHHVESVNFKREQGFKQRTGQEPGYDMYGKSRDHSYHHLNQLPGPDFPHEMDDAVPPGDYDHVQRYLHTCPDAETLPSGNVLVPVQSTPRRHSSIGQSYTCQTSPTQPNLPDQKYVFNVHHKRQDQKEGLRDWRISSYLTALQHSGQDDLADIQRTDSCDNVPYVMQGRRCNPETSETRQDNSEFTKAPISKLNTLQIQPINTLTLSEKPLDLPTDFRTYPAAKPTPPTTSESSEGDKMEEVQNREPKEINLIREEFVRTRPNLALQRSSRLRHSLIFNSNLEQHTSEDIKNSSSQNEGTTSLKHPVVASNTLEKKRPVTREPFQWSGLMKSCDLPSDSAVKFESEDVPSKEEPSETDKSEITKVLQKVSEQEKSSSQRFQPQNAVTESLQTTQLPTAVPQKSASFIDMNDPECRLRFFKELAAKRKAELANRSTKDKASNEPDNPKKSLHSKGVEKKELALDSPKNPQVVTLTSFPQELPVDTVKNSQDSSTKTIGLQILPDKHLKYKLFPDSKMTQELTSPKADSSSKAIPVSATDAEKIELKQKLTKVCDSFSNMVEDKSSSAVNTAVQLNTKPKITSQLSPTSNISSPEFMCSQSKLLNFTDSGLSNSPYVLRQKNVKLSSRDSISSQVIDANTSLKPCSAEPTLKTTTATAKNTVPSQQSTAQTSLCAPVTETSLSKHALLAETGPSQHSTVADIAPSQHFSAADTRASQHCTTAETGPLQHSTPAETRLSKHSFPSVTGHVGLTDTTQHITAKETCSSQHPTAEETVSSQHKAVKETGLFHYPIAKEMSPSQQLTSAGLAKMTDITQQTTAKETGLSQHPNSEETSSSPHPTVKETSPSQHPTSTVFAEKRVTIQHPTAEEMESFQNSGPSQHATSTILAEKIDIDQHSAAKETSPSQYHTSDKTGSSPHATAKDTDLFQHSTAEETGSSQHPSAKETGIFQHSTTKETGSSQHSSIEETGSSQHPTAKENDTSLHPIQKETSPSQHPMAEENDSFQYSTAKDAGPSQHPISEETGSSQHPTAEEAGPFQHATSTSFAGKTDIDQYTTAEAGPLQHPISEETGSSQHPTLKETGPSQHPIAKENSPYQHLILTGLAEKPNTSQHFMAEEADSFQHSTAKEAGPSQRATSISLAEKIDIIQQTTAKETGFSQHSTTKETGLFEHPTVKKNGSSPHHTKKEASSFQHSTAKENGSSQDPTSTVFAEKTIHIQHPMEEETDSYQHSISAVLAEKTVNTEHPTAKETRSSHHFAEEVTCSSQHPTAKETSSSQHSAAEETGFLQHPTAEETSSSQHSAAEETSSSQYSAAEETSTSEHPTTQEKCPSPNITSAVSAQKTDTIQLFTANETVSSPHPSIEHSCSSQLSSAAKADYPQHLIAGHLNLQTESNSSLHPNPSEPYIHDHANVVGTSLLAPSKQMQTTLEVASENAASAFSIFDPHSNTLTEEDNPPSTTNYTNTKLTSGFLSSETALPLNVIEVESGSSQHTSAAETDKSIITNNCSSFNDSPIEIAEKEMDSVTTPSTILCPEDLSTKENSLNTGSNITSPPDLSLNLTETNPATSVFQTNISSEDAAPDSSHLLLKAVSLDINSPNNSISPETDLCINATVETASAVGPSQTDKSQFTQQSPVETSAGFKMTSPIYSTLAESESFQNIPETSSFTNTKTKDRNSQNVSLTNLTKPGLLKEYSEYNLLTNFAASECGFAHPVQKDSTPEPGADQTVTLTTVCPTNNDFNPNPLISLSSATDILSHSSSDIGQPAVPENLTDLDITDSGTPSPSKLGKEISYLCEPKSGKDKDDNEKGESTKEQIQQQKSVDLTRHVAVDVPKDLDNDKGTITKEVTAHGTNAGSSSAEQSQEPQSCQASHTDSVKQQSLAVEKPTLQSSTVNVLSCSNLRDDTKVLLEQISAKNQERASKKKEEDNANMNTTTDKQISGHPRSRPQTWSSKASSEEREQLLKKMESMRKEKKVYSRFEA